MFLGRRHPTQVWRSCHVSLWALERYRQGLLLPWRLRLQISSQSLARVQSTHYWLHGNGNAHLRGQSNRSTRDMLPTADRHYTQRDDDHSRLGRLACPVSRLGSFVASRTHYSALKSAVSDSDTDETVENMKAEWTSVGRWVRRH